MEDGISCISVARGSCFGAPRRGCGMAPTRWRHSLESSALSNPRTASPSSVLHPTSSPVEEHMAGGHVAGELVLLAASGLRSGPYTLAHARACCVPCCRSVRHTALALYLRVVVHLRYASRGLGAIGTPRAILSIYLYLSTYIILHE